MTARKGPPQGGGGVDVFTPEEVVAAFDRALGMPSVVARLLKCSRTTVYKYMNRYPEVKAAARRRNAELGDELEYTGAAIALDSSHPRQSDMVRYLLSTKFRHRGYVKGLNVVANTQVVEEADQAIRDLGMDPNKVFSDVRDQARAEKRRRVLDGVLDATVQ